MVDSFWDSLYNPVYGQRLLQSLPSKLQKDKHDFVEKDVTSSNDKTYLHDSICTKHSVHQIRTLTTARGGF